MRSTPRAQPPAPVAPSPPRPVRKFSSVGGVAAPTPTPTPPTPTPEAPPAATSSPRLETRSIAAAAAAAERYVHRHFYRVLPSFYWIVLGFGSFTYFNGFFCYRVFLYDAHLFIRHVPSLLLTKLLLSFRQVLPSFFFQVHLFFRRVPSFTEFFFWAVLLFERVRHRFHGFYSVLPYVTRSYQLPSSFTEFYRVLTASLAGPPGRRRPATPRAPRFRWRRRSSRTSARRPAIPTGKFFLPISLFIKKKAKRTRK